MIIIKTVCAPLATLGCSHIYLAYSGGQKYCMAPLVINQLYAMCAILGLKTLCSSQIVVNEVLNQILGEIKWNVSKCRIEE